MESIEVYKRECEYEGECGGTFGGQKGKGEMQLSYNLKKKKNGQFDNNKTQKKMLFIEKCSKLGRDGTHL